MKKNSEAKERLRKAALCAWVQEIMQAAKDATSSRDRGKYSAVLGRLQSTVTDLRKLSQQKVAMPVAMSVGQPCETDDQCPEGQICDIGTGNCTDPLPPS